MRLTAEIEGRPVSLSVRRLAEGRYEVLLDDRAIVVDAIPSPQHGWSLLIDGASHDVSLERTAGGFRVHGRGTSTEVALRETASAAMAASTSAGPSNLRAPMPGRIVRVLAAPGAEVSAGDGLVVVEAMKMENELKASRAGIIRAIHVREGQAVEGGALLVEME